MHTILILILLLLIPQFAHAEEEAKPVNVESEELEAGDLFLNDEGEYTGPIFDEPIAELDDKKRAQLDDIQKECLVLRKHIKQDMQDMRECYTDADCVSITYGCPWQRTPCHQTVISLTNDETHKQLVTRIAKYRKLCVEPFPEIAAHCDAFHEEVANSKCTQLDTMCVTGRCVNQMETLYDDIGYFGRVLDLGHSFEDLEEAQIP